ncbi:MAG: LCP family protein [Chloroflexales bacterium]
MPTSRASRQPTPAGGEPYTAATKVMRQPKRSRWVKLRLGLLAALGVGLVGLGLLYWQVHRLAQAITVADVRPNPPFGSPLLGANVLLIGTDERPDHPEEGVRSDTLILARLDAAGRWVSLLAIPRDSQVALPQVGLETTKINVAYGQGYAAAQALYRPAVTPQQGGMALAAQTVETFLGLPKRSMRVDFVATVNFAGFAGLIDALGGVTVDVPTYILDAAYPTEDFGVMRVEFQPGPQYMDGKTALIYARTRHQDSDFGRAERQQQVVRAILQAFRAKGALGQALLLPSLLRAVAGEAGGTPPVLTTLPLDRPDVLLGLLGLASGLDPDAMGQFRLGANQLSAEDGSNLIFDPVAVQTLLDQWQRAPSEAREAATVQVFNGTAVDGLASQVSFDLERQGFRMLPPGNGPSAERTRVYDVGGASATSRRLARTLSAELLSGPPPDVTSAATIVVIIGPPPPGG